MIIETVATPLLAQPRRAVVARAPRRPILAMACWGYLLAVIVVWLVMRETGDRWWIGTVLLIVPRWPFAVPVLALLPWAIGARRWSLVAATTVAAGVVLMPIMGFRVSLPRTAPERGDVRVLTCNVHRQHLNAEGLAEYVAAVRPDVVALQGWSATDHESLFTDGWDVHREGELLIASRYPIGSITPLKMEGTAGTPQGELGAAALFELRTPRGSIYLINLHLASPHAGLLSVSDDTGGKLAGNIEQRSRESDKVRTLADSAPGPLLLVGDFNTTGESPIFREHWRDFADAFIERGSGFGYTYLIGHTQLRIDHVLAGTTWEFLRCWVGPDIGSPHRPLVADVNYR